MRVIGVYMDDLKARFLRPQMGAAFIERPDRRYSPEERAENKRPHVAPSPTFGHGFDSLSTNCPPKQQR